MSQRPEHGVLARAARDMGDRVQFVGIVYEDEDGAGLPDPDKVHRSSASVHCSPRIAFGDIVFADYGQDTAFFVSGGCERNARGNFEFGFPDKYMDADELISYNFAFASNEDNDMFEVVASLRCVVATSSLELGIDVGSIDLVCQIQSAKSVSTGMQRIGRAGHLLHATSEGRLLITDRDDLVESAVLVRQGAVQQRLDQARLAAKEISADMNCMACHDNQYCQDCHEGE